MGCYRLLPHCWHIAGTWHEPIVTGCGERTGRGSSSTPPRLVSGTERAVIEFCRCCQLFVAGYSALYVQTYIRPSVQYTPHARTHTHTHTLSLSPLFRIIDITTTLGRLTKLEQVTRRKSPHTWIALRVASPLHQLGLAPSDAPSFAAVFPHNCRRHF